MTEPERLLTSAEVAATLGVSPGTVYEWTVRGLLRPAEPLQRGRARRYPAGEVERMRQDMAWLTAMRGSPWRAKR